MGDDQGGGARVPITRLNHAVLYVRDASRTVRFYEDVLGFVEIVHDDLNRWSFLRAPGSSNHHDLALFTIGEGAAASEAGQRTVGMYHIAWEVPTLEELEVMRERLDAAGALIGASDHGVNKSLYSRDPDGLEFEVMWLTPPEQWGDEESQAIVRPLDLDGDKVRYGATTVSNS